MNERPSALRRGAFAVLFLCLLLDTIGSARFFGRPEWPMTVRRAGNERYELLHDGAVVGTIRYASGHWIYVTFTTLPKNVDARTNVELRLRDDQPGVFF